MTEGSRFILWRRPLMEKLRHAYRLDDTTELPLFRSLCGKTCTTIPPGSDEPGGMECEECCNLVAAPAIEDWERQHRVAEPMKPAGIYTAGLDQETDDAVATLQRWKARIRREALIEAAAIVERDAHEYVRTGYPVRVKLRAVAKELRALADECVETVPTPDTTQKD